MAYMIIMATFVAVSALWAVWAANWDVWRALVCSIGLVAPMVILRIIARMLK